MNFTLDEIAAIIGTKELEIISLRRELAKKEQEIAALKEPKVEQITGDVLAEGKLAGTISGTP